MADEDWTIATAVEKANSFIENNGLPLPRRPTGWGKEYTFPVDPHAITGIELSQIMLHLAGYMGYANKLLAEQDVLLSTYESVYEIRVGKLMNEASEALGKKVLKDQLRAIVLSDNPDLKRMTQGLMDLKAVVKRLQYQVKIYSDQLAALSREQSRREAELRSLR